MKIKWLLFSFMAGLLLGVAGTLFGANWIGPHMPEFMQNAMVTVEGEVMRKQKEPDRVLLTIVTANGSTLASFLKQASQVELLVEQGDQISLALPRYEPFVTDPVILHVQKMPDRHMSTTAMSSSDPVTRTANQHPFVETLGDRDTH